MEEPPPSVTLKWLVGYRTPDRIPDSPPEPSPHGKTQMRSFDKLPVVIQQDMIKTSGLTETEFFKRRQEKLKQRYGK